ncbi:MAG TPA: GEVED domain-containing protein, partial [Chitinophagales bacterium]|nr:GEVED domain-containing protein [Chitinophagales bacterium]
MKKILQRLFLLAITISLFQGSAIAQPQYYNINTSAGANAIPLGGAGYPTNKCQFLYGPNVFNTNGTTGTPAFNGFITTVYFRVNSYSAAVVYSDFTISLVQNVGVATTFPTTTFGTLVPSFYQPTYSLPTPLANDWVAITLQTPFLYNPAQSLIFEMKASGSVGGATTSNGMRTGTGSRLYGTYSAATGTSSTATLVDFGFDLIPPTPCSGTPTAGTISYIPGCPSQVKLTGATLAGGINVQWQKRLACGGTWANIPGATGYMYTYNIPAQSAPTEYRAYITCNTGGQTDTSAAVFVNNVAPCYCASGATNASYHDITQVTLGSLSNASPCVGGGGTYTSFTSTVPPPNLMKGDTYLLSVEVTNCGTATISQGVAVFIDYNQDGTYALSERVSATTAMNSANAFTVTDNITIPTSALPGITGMRVISAYNIAGTGITGCQSSTYGETEDYYVNIQFAPAVTGSGLV